MAQETLGVWGGNLATVAYLFLRYTCVVAYTSKSGEVLSHLIGLPASTLQPLHAPRGTAHTGRWHDHHRPSESMADRHNDRFTGTDRGHVCLLWWWDGLSNLLRLGEGATDHLLSVHISEAI